jgi:hypothetical protein
MPGADTASTALSQPKAENTIPRRRLRLPTWATPWDVWEGDTLLLDSISFVDWTWVGRAGFFHSDQMHVVERFKRQGDVILYDVTVEDPEVLVELWVLPRRTLRRNTNPNAA